MKNKKKAKAVAPAQALFDEMEGVASTEDATSSVFGSAAEALADSETVLAEAEQAEFAAVAPRIVAREEAAILGRYVNVDPPEEEAAEDEPAGPAQEAEPASEGEASGLEGGQPVDKPGLAAEPPARKNRTAMDSVALVFLEDAIARRLAVAWEVCGGVEDDWYDAAGMTSQQRQQARQVGRALRLHGICRDGGVIDALALEYIRAVIARPLKATAPAKKKP